MSSVVSSLITRPVITGLLNGAMAYYMIPYNKTPVPLLGGSVSIPLLMGAAGAASNFITGAVTQNILPKITSNPMVLNSTMIVEPAIAGATNIGLAAAFAPQLLQVSNVGAMKLGLMGAASEIGGNYGASYLHNMGY